MNITIEASALRAALKTAGRVIPQKSPWPILTNLKIVTNDDRITVTGSDGDMTFEADVVADVQTEGAVILPFAPLSAFCAAAKSDNVTLALADGAVKVTAGKSRISLSAGDVADYPNNRASEGEAITMDADTFVRGLRFASIAASKEEARYNLQGAFVTSRYGNVKIIGTDGYGLHVATLPDAPDVGEGAIIPAAAVGIICDAADGKDTLSLSITEKGWMAAVPGLRMWGKVVDGTYPDVQRIIAGFDPAITFMVAPQEAFATAVRVATCGADTVSGKGRGLIFIADPGKPVIVRGGKASSGVTAAGRAEIDAEAIDEARFQVSSEYLMRAIGGLSGDIAMAAKGQDGVTLRPARDDAHIELFVIVMGIRTSAEDMRDE